MDDEPDQQNDQNEQDKPAEKKAHGPQPGLTDMLKASIADAWAVVQQSRSVTGAPSQLWLGAFLGICLVFLAAILAVQRVDTPLTIALLAFVVALPLLGCGFVIASVDFGHGRAEIVTAGFKVAAQVLGQGLGSLAVLVGVVAVIWHINRPIAIVGLIMLVATAGLYVVVELLYARHVSGEQQQSSAVAPVPAPPV